MILVLLMVLACVIGGGDAPTATISIGETPEILLPTSEPPDGTSALATDEPPTDTAATELPDLSEVTEEPTLPSPALTLDQLLNGTYHLPYSNQWVTLVNGRFDREESPTVDEIELHAEILEPIAFGELDGDGDEDAAVLFSERIGSGPEIFVSVLVMLNEGGLPVEYFHQQKYIDDRPLIHSMSIISKRIVLDAVIHGYQDPVCCPNYPVVESFQPFDDQLFLVRFASRTPGGEERAITITSPAPESTVYGSTHVSGTVTISPFENTLAYKIYDFSGNTLSSGSIMVNSEEMGAPGTIDADISFAGISVGTPVRLELSELSMRDGSMVAMDSIDLITG
jgi:hypothetical protein